MSTITKPQIAKIHLLAKDRGMDKDLLHSYVYALVGKESIKGLNVKEAGLVIDGLSGRKVNRSGDYNISFKQKVYIKKLATKIGWVLDGELDEKRLNGFIRKQYNALYLDSLSSAEASKCIEALKSFERRKAR